MYSEKPGKGIPLLFLNGLSDSMESWTDVVKGLGTERPCLFLDLPGQGDSLRLELKTKSHPSFFIRAEEQTGFILELLDELRVAQFGLIGFSYGGGIALKLASLCPEIIHELILISPFILRLDLSLPMSRFWVAQFSFAKSLTPQIFHQPYKFMENSYERFIENYMNFRYLNKIPDPQQRKVAVELSRGIMEFNSFEILNSLPSHKLILLSAERDTLVPQNLFSEFWQTLAPHQKRAWVQVEDGEHLILEQSPEFCARFLKQALSGQLKGVSEVRLGNKSRHTHAS